MSLTGFIFSRKYRLIDLQILKPLREEKIHCRVTCSERKKDGNLSFRNRRF